MINKIFAGIIKVSPSFLKPHLLRVRSRINIFLDILKVIMSKSIGFEISPGVAFRIYKNTRVCFDFFTDKTKEIEVYYETQSFLKIARTKRCLLDIGAHYGAFSLAFTCNDPDKKAFAIEPSPKPFCILKAHAGLNPGCDIKPFRVAMGSSNGRLQMKYEWEHLVASSKNDSPQDCYSIKAVKLDDFVKDNNISPDLIKIDVEGAEFFVLQGGAQYLKSHDPVICLEVHAKWLEKLGITTGQLVDLLDSFGYKVYDLRFDPIKDAGIALSDKPNCRVVCSKQSLM